MTDNGDTVLGSELSQPDTPFDRPFNIEDSAPVNTTSWTSFSTGSVSVAGTGSISGSWALTEDLGSYC